MNTGRFCGILFKGYLYNVLLKWLWFDYFEYLNMINFANMRKNYFSMEIIPLIFFKPSRLESK